MRSGIAICIILGISSVGLSQKSPSVQGPVTKFEVGRRFFFDFGPPNDFYDLFLVRSAGDKTSVERITLTPTGINKCIAPPKVDVQTALLERNVSELMEGKNPCAIPEKELRRERKRCKKCMVFSGADVTIQVECGGQTRLIRSDILDRDLFDPALRTPEHTSWTMRLLQQLEAPFPPGAIYRPVFPVPQEQESSQTAALDPAISQELAAGKYDALFVGAPDKPSQLYDQSLQSPPSPTVELVSSSPIAPDVFVPPKYPPIAKLARVEGSVSAKVEIDETGIVSNATIEAGPPLLGETTRNAALGWRFPKGDGGREALVTVKFASNCPPQAN